MEQQPHRTFERTKSKQKQNQARHIQIHHAFCCSILLTNNGIIKRMASLADVRVNKLTNYEKYDIWSWWNSTFLNKNK